MVKRSADGDPDKRVERRESGAVWRGVRKASPSEAPVSSAARPSEARQKIEAAAPPGPVSAEDHIAALATLAAGVAQEINNPLTYLMVRLEHVTRRLRALGASAAPGSVPDELSVEAIAVLVESLGEAVDGARRVRQTVRQLMTFSQGASDKRALVDVRAVLESSIQMSWHALRPRARVVKQLSEVPPVDANEARLGQVFMSLLSAAGRAIPEGKPDAHEVRIATRTLDGGRILVEIADTGAGVVAAALPRVFDPFFSAADSGEGVGLSLAVAYGTVKDLGGDLSCESEEGKGTVFRVVLPAADGWRDARSGAEPRGRSRIAVIDGDPAVGAAMALALERECDVSVLERAEDALDRLAGGEEFDAIICDLSLASMSGVDFYANTLRVAPEAVRRIVFTNGGSLTKRARAFLKSVHNPCLDKPIDEQQLRSILRLVRDGTRPHR